MAKPVPVTEARPQHHPEEDWVEFFACHRQVNQKKEETETLKENKVRNCISETLRRLIMFTPVDLQRTQWCIDGLKKLK